MYLFMKMFAYLLKSYHQNSNAIIHCCPLPRVIHEVAVSPANKLYYSFYQQISNAGFIIYLLYQQISNAD